MVDPIEEIKSRLDVAELLREYIRLIPAGGNFKAVCPFHQEKSPSFMVSPAKQIWHCFGCAEGGDIFKFVMKQEGVTFPEALRILAQKTGVTLTRQDPNTHNEKSRYYDALALAATYFHQALLKAPQAQIARDYVLKRGIPETQIDEFSIGFSLPENDKLFTYLTSKKFSAHELVQVGLALKSDRGPGYYDRFRNRLMFPIRNVHGQITGFGGRILEDNKEVAKYINSPQTPVYDKGKTVFGLDKAKQEARKLGYVILVEGYMDYLASYKAGVTNVVASSGTALTIDQIKLIKRFTGTFLFCFDTDMAGNQATVRGIDLALSEGVRVKVITLPRNDDGSARYKDPDECITKNVADWHEAIANAKNYVEYYFQEMIRNGIPSDSYEKRTVARTLLAVVARLRDRIEQDHWIKFLGSTLSISEHILWEELQKTKQQGPTPKPGTPEKVATNHNEQGPQYRETSLMALLLKHPAHIKNTATILKPQMIHDEAYCSLYKALLAVYTESNCEMVCEELFTDERLSGFSSLKDTLLLFADKEYEAVDSTSVQSVITDITLRIKQQYIHSRRQELQIGMRDAEKRHDMASMERFAAEFKELNTL